MGTTDVMMNYIYTRAFSYFEFGYAAACGLMMGIFVFTTSMCSSASCAMGRISEEGSSMKRKKQLHR